MSRRALALAGAALAVAAAPATAYEALPKACATYVPHSDAGAPPATCKAGGAPQFGGSLDTMRDLDVTVANGAVLARLTCKHTWWANSAEAVFYASTETQSLQVHEQDGMTCVSELIAYADDTTATGVSTFSFRAPREVK